MLRDPAMSPPLPEPARPSWLWWLPLAGAAAAFGLFAYAVAHRLPYPFELEWMEGAMVDHASRIADGLPLYCEPGPEHVPFLYAPLLFWLGGIAMKLGVDGLLALRLIALGSALGSAMLIGHWVRRECGRVVPGLCASGMFFAGYGWLAWWYDLARNDTLFVFLCLATAYQVRHGPRWRWLFAGLLATAALLAKQSALMWLPAVGVGALLVDWRTALRFAAVTTVASGIALGWMHLASEGWSTFYLFEMPRHHGWDGSRKLGYWTQDLRPIWPLLALGLLGFVAQWRRSARAMALSLAAFGSGAIVTSWLSRLHVGGFDNVLMYAFAGACVLGPIAAAERGRVLRIVGPLALLAQFVWLGQLAYARGGATLLPSPAHRHAHEQLAAWVRAQPGPVWIPGHGGIAYRAGKGTGAHGQAIFDLLQALPKRSDGMLDIEALADRSRLAPLPERAQRAICALLDHTTEALQQRRFAAIVVDEIGAWTFTAVFAAGLAGETYVRSPAALLDDPAAIRPLLGYDVHAPYAMLPRR